MKVVYVIDGLGAGGAERSLAELVPVLEEQGIDVVVCTRFRRHQGVEDDLRRHGADIRHLGGRPPAQLRALRAVLRAERPDVLHTTLFGATLLGRLASRGLPVAVLTSLVNTPYEPIRAANDPNLRRSSMRAVQAVDRLTARWTAHFHAITQAVKDAAVHRLGVAPERITVIERGRDPARLGTASPERRRAARAALGLGDDALVVLTAGRQEFQKGHVFLLEAAARLAQDRPGLVTLVAGRDGNATSTLRQRHEELGLGDRVRFLGHRSDVPDLLAAADVFAFPSLFEGLGGVLIEAMALGVAIVAADVPAVRETVAGAGVLVPPADAGALAGALDRLLGDEAERRRLGERGRARFEDRYTLERSAARTVELYRTLAGVTAPGR